MARILVVDDEPNICWALQAYLTAEGHGVDVAGTAADAIELLDAARPDLVISDIRLPGAGGLDLLERTQAMVPAVPVILMTAYGSLDTGVAAMHRGAFEYLHKPLDLDRLGDVVRQALAGRPSGGPGEAVSAGEESTHARLVGRSVPMQEVYKRIGLVSRADVTVLLEGASGVGKELVARAIHEHGPRRNGPFVAINCASLPDSLFESEVFGYERGAFTGASATKVGRYELAHGGTLFLDEVSELSPGGQAALLRVLEDGSVERLGGTRSIRVDVRLVAATNRSLRETVAARRFREDLYFRLRVVSIGVPALRERKEDIPDLVEHFVRLAARETGRQPRAVDDAAMRALQRYDWPGNVRELKNTIRGAMVVARGPVIGERDLPAEILSVTVERTPGPEDGSLATMAEAELRARLGAASTGSGSIYHDLIETVEARLVSTALEITGGNQVRAAELLGVHRTTLRKRMTTGTEPDEEPSGN